MMKATCYSETSVLSTATRHHVTEDDIPHSTKHLRQQLLNFTFTQPSPKLFLHFKAAMPQYLSFLSITELLGDKLRL
jgi:hypothetical protein